MIVKSRRLNVGEIFPCSLKKAKDVFRNSAVTLNFSYTGRTYGTFSRTPDAFYLKNKIKGIVVSSMSAHCRNENALLSFYVVKEASYPKNLQTKFENDVLFEYYNFYHSLLNTEFPDNKTHIMLVELIDSEFHLHRFFM